MASSLALPPEIALPASLLPALCRSVTAEVGDDAAAQALRQAGDLAGDAFTDVLAKSSPAAAASGRQEGSGPSALASTPEPLFWKVLSDVFAARGWGKLEHESLHAGVGALDSADWIEADPSSAALRPSCHFTAGLLAKLLSRAAGDTVDVVESECRSRGDLRCRFLFGSLPMLQWIDQALASDRDLEAALADLA